MLTCVYNNSNKVQGAQERLMEIKQGDPNSLAQYIAKFECGIYEARVHDRPDHIIISIFHYASFLRIVQQLASASSTYTAPTNQHHSTTPIELGNINAMELGKINALSISLEERNN
ncbi:hypothetical protein PHISCL_04521 [Aspergillus sclerotialis]|uniref:Retrotransposon gag domain-containing protein n=1 Tax=Aspergillus sclerotialis TaxID=2070753 RepID=A0A3A2ZKP0_9EURO|nr:hypothetical protein PHISCL_04521 [Aspergillus sclerotialis]